MIPIIHHLSQRKKKQQQQQPKRKKKRRKLIKQNLLLVRTLVEHFLMRLLRVKNLFFFCLLMTFDQKETK